MRSWKQLRGGSDTVLEAMIRQHLVEQFYYTEAALLDDRRYREWLGLFANDVHYLVPIRRTRLRADLDKEFTKPGEMASSTTPRRCWPIGSGSWRRVARGLRISVADPPPRHQRPGGGRRRARARRRLELPPLPHPAQVRGGLVDRFPP